MFFFKKKSDSSKQETENRLEIKKDRKENELCIKLIGRMNAVTAPELGKVVENELSGVRRLVLDMTELEYISSAGLRVIMSALEVLRPDGSMALLNPGEAVMDVLDETGMNDFMEIIRDR